jgi:sterol desaturase/sphingolipid hydroxylase (fatty acid hydroxylase superfamily)
VRLSGFIIGGWFATLIISEHYRALRRSVEPKLRRNTRNLAIAGLGAVVVHALESPAAFIATDYVETRRFGLVQKLALPVPLRDALAILLMDYTLYLWHVMTHRVPALWRFHKVHHIDRDLDASTALRFHFGELAVSVPFRVAQVLSIGTSRTALTVWQLLLFLSILFHHSNVRLPPQWERRIAYVIMTPTLHGIHHSVQSEEVNSNWSSGLTLWDRLHGTLRAEIPKPGIKIGVPGFDLPEQVTLPQMVVLPFQRNKDQLEA